MKATKTRLVVATVMVLSMVPVGAVDLINQRDPNYLRSIDRLNEARQAMERASRLVREAQAVYSIREFDYARLLGDITAVTGQLDAALLPEERRQRHQVIHPDSIYFLPKEAQP